MIPCRRAEESRSLGRGGVSGRPSTVGQPSRSPTGRCWQPRRLVRCEGSILAVLCHYSRTQPVTLQGIFKHGLVVRPLACAPSYGHIHMSSPSPSLVAASQLGPEYGPTFILGSAFLIVAAIVGSIDPAGKIHYYFAAAANGIQNGMTSMYTGNPAN